MPHQAMLVAADPNGVLRAAFVAEARQISSV